MKPYYETKLGKLYHGDCLEIMPHLEPVDLVLTDPPYGTTACSWDSVISFGSMWNILYRILRPNGFIVLTASQPFTSKLVCSNIDKFSHNWVWNKKRGTGHLLAKKRPMMASEDIVVFSNEHSHDFTFRSPLRKYAVRIFDYIGKTKKEIFSDMGNQSVCHFMRTKSAQFNICTEKCYNKLIGLYGINKMEGFVEYNKLRNENDIYLKSFPVVYNPQMRNRDKPRQSKMKSSKNTCYGDLKYYSGDILYKRYPINIIEFDKSGHDNMLFHPTQKPVSLMEYLTKTYTNDGDTILDFTIGSGTTAIACERLNRRWIGIEIEEKYCEIAKERIERELQQKKLPGF